MNLSNVTDMSETFSGCTSLNSIWMKGGEEITVGAENGKSAIKPSTFGEYDESQHRYISAGIKKGGTLRTTQSVGMSGLFYGWMLPCFDFSWNLILE